ncbi:MAG: hypothetical protein VKO39_07575 [Cyanobacteriota bacterium]|nr:hypothetical protein [Cyanobacteriota bacterium]
MIFALKWIEERVVHLSDQQRETVSKLTTAEHTQQVPLSRQAIDRLVDPSSRSIALCTPEQAASAADKKLNPALISSLDLLTEKQVY